MPSLLETARIVALLRATDAPWSHHSDSIDEHGSALPALQEQHGLLADALAEAELPTLDAWAARGLNVVTLLDPAYPENLRGIYDRPPLVFLNGQYQPQDARSIAVVGSRHASPAGLAAARALAAHLTASNYTVVSGLARGIDGAAHREALSQGGRTVAVIGTGIAQVYPTEHAALQAEIAVQGAVLSQFWPDAAPDRRSFPMRNAVMSGMALGTAIVEATETSGTRIQARRALMHGRPVFIRHTLLSQPWARALAARPGAHVYTSPAEITETLGRLTPSSTLSGP